MSPDSPGAMDPYSCRVRHRNRQTPVLGGKRAGPRKRQQTDGPGTGTKKVRSDGSIPPHSGPGSL